jgi:iron complex transport system substrate-binding protein
MIGGLVGLAAEADALAARLEAGLDAIRTSSARFAAQPGVFFEEWDDPLISGIQWVEELVEIAGGRPVFPELRRGALARDRIVSPDVVRDRAPDVVFASWCGKKVRKDRIAGRPGWSSVPAVRNGHVYEITSSVILQPGPAALTEGVRQIHALLARVAGLPIDQSIAPAGGLDTAGWPST